MAILLACVEGRLRVLELTVDDAVALVELEQEVVNIHARIGRVLQPPTRDAPVAEHHAHGVSAEAYEDDIKEQSGVARSCEASDVGR